VRLLRAVWWVLAAAAAASAAWAAPTAAELETLRARNGELGAKLRSVESQTSAGVAADAAVFGKAVDYVLRYPDEFYRPEYYANAIALAQEGLRRAGQLQRGLTPWNEARGLVCRGYISAVDGSVQPYCVWVPLDYDPSKPTRLDVVLHGRSQVLSEVSFLTSGLNGRIVATETGRKGPPPGMTLYVFGRGNNSYRWAGESDVFEAMAAVEAHYRIDPNRIVLRGFSMGGTGAWHLGLHFPSRWAAVEAGAGFVETRPEVLKTIHDSWRLPSLAIHDASNCSVNMTDVPFVAYAGSRDPQRLQHDLIRKVLDAEGVDLAQQPRIRFLVGENFGHNFSPERKRESDAFIAGALPRREPQNFRFVTYTPGYGEFWDFQVDSLDQLYRRAELSGTPDRVQTKNVWVLKLDRPRKLNLDGQDLTGAVFERTNGAWRVGEPAGLRKRAGLQGPIDDAFQQPFLCVGPVGGADPVLEQFRADFARYLRGDVRVKAPGDVLPADWRDYNLILFGDPATNPWIRRVLPGLPLTWTADKIEFGGRSFPAAGNTVALIYPNPLNPNRYVVLNSGHTFPGNAFDDLHWYLHPRLGDYAVLDQNTREVRAAGFFDRNWLIPAKAENLNRP